jgi:hypothetical protein
MHVRGEGDRPNGLVPFALDKRRVIMEAWAEQVGEVMRFASP